ncbi:MAG TPA: 1-deoxy-D-xylulose-5-phosphate reductoisomerase [Bacillota bacterium]|nr:1-deoxy-D-xylulose-5-phosphate reductoisomerase [Bacillota bacterium]
MKTITLLGSTGSIGTQALEVIESLSMKCGVLCAGTNYKLLETQCRRFCPEIAYIDESKYSLLKTALADTPVRVVTGEDALCECAAYEKSDIVLNSLLGIRGLRPMAAAIEAHKTIALANKETLVTGGSLIMAAAKKNGVRILPVDSEHSAIFQCMQGHVRPSRLILTASGGAFYGKPDSFLAAATAADALCHPTWNMGKKITVDCATLMNKGFEFIEAAHLFSFGAEKIDVIVHRESIVHSMVEFEDGSILAQLGAHDMRLPIQYALTYPERTGCIAKKISLSDVGTLHFETPDEKRFPLLMKAKECFKRGTLSCSALNGADEAAVALFLEGKTDYMQMIHLICDAADNADTHGLVTLESIEEADGAAREYVKTHCTSHAAF